MRISIGVAYGRPKYLHDDGVALLIMSKESRIEGYRGGGVSSVKILRSCMKSMKFIGSPRKSQKPNAVVRPRP